MRLLDVSLSALGLVVLTPVLIASAILVKRSSRGPVVYRARRVGQDGRLFELYKFRTMIADAAAKGPRVTGSNDMRVTPVGRFLRRTKIDELPQLFNILKGDMSLVGPRPEDPEYVKSYSPEQRQLLRVKPGITSLATVLHRHEEQLLGGPDWEETYRREILPAKLKIELDYLAERTFLKDMSILGQTARALFAKPKQLRGERGLPCRS